MASGRGRPLTTPSRCGRDRTPVEGMIVDVRLLTRKLIHNQECHKFFRMPRFREAAARRRVKLRRGGSVAIETHSWRGRFPSRQRGCKNAGAACKLVSMPELPDIAAYISALEPRIVGQPIERVRLASAFLLRTVQPPIASVEGRIVRELRRIGKRIAIGVEGDLWLVLHLMIAGRLHWRPPGAKLSGRNSLAAFDFPNGSLVLTEAGSKRRASLHVLSRRGGLAIPSTREESRFSRAI